MNHLKYFDGEGNLTPLFTTQSDDAQDGDLVFIYFDAKWLAESARLFFSGYFPIDAPYFSGGNGIPLPWAEKYWPIDADGPLSIASDLATALEELGFHSGPVEELAAYNQAYFEGPQGKIQGLAAELILRIDEWLSFLRSREHYRAMRAQGTAHRVLVELTLQAEWSRERDVSTGTYASEFSRLGSAARHSINHQLNNFAVDLFRSGRFPSANRASIAITDEVLAESKRLGGTLKAESAQKTIYNWLLKSQRK